MNRKLAEKGIFCFKYFFLLMIFTFFLLMAQDVYSSEDVIYSRDYFHGDEFFVNGVGYTLFPSTSYDRVLVQSSDSNFWVNKNNCNYEGNLRVCYESLQFDSGRNEYSLTLRVSLIYPRLVVNQVSDDASLSLGDETEITVTIENDGLLDAESIVYMQRLPDGLSFISEENHGLSFSNGYVKFESSEIRAGEDIVFYYTILASGRNDEPLQSEVNFFNGFTTRNTFSNSINVNVDSPYGISLSSNSTESKVGDEIKLILEISNDADAKVDIESSKIFIPSIFEVLRKDSRLAQNSGYLEYVGEISDNSNLELDVVLKAINTGVVDIRSQVALSGISFDLEGDIRVAIEQPVTQHTLFFVRDGRDERIFQDLSENNILDGQQRGQIELFITNPYSSRIENARAVLSSEFINMTSSFATIGSRNSRRLIDNTFVTPYLESSRRDTLKINLTYTTEFGYFHSELIEKTLSFEPVRDLEVRHTLSTSRPESGETVSVIVTARNTRRSDLYDVEIKDILPENILIRGSNLAKNDISAGSTETFFEYFIDLPIVSRETDFEIFSEVKYSDGTSTFEIIVPYEFTIRPRNPDVQLRRTRDSQGPVRIGEFVDVSYEIRNREDYRITDIIVELPGVKGTYLVDSIEHKISSLNPGQERSLERIERRVVFDESTSISLGRPNVIFADDQSIIYWQEGPTLSVSLEEDSFSLPKLHISKKVEGIDSQTFRYTKTVENVGNLHAEFILNDATEEVYSISPGEVIEVNGTSHFNDYPDLVLPRSYLSFVDGPYTYYALTDNIDLESYILYEDYDGIDTIIEETVADDTAHDDEINDIDDTPDYDHEFDIGEEIESDQDDEPATKSFFRRVWNYFMGLLGLN